MESLGEMGGNTRKVLQLKGRAGKGREGQGREGRLTIFGRVGSLGGRQNLAGRSPVLAHLMQEVDGFPNKQDLWFSEGCAPQKNRRGRWKDRETEV